MKTVVYQFFPLQTDEAMSIDRFSETKNDFNVALGIKLDEKKINLEFYE